ncbi:MAG: hypothetical protein ABFD89_05825 [Bryobacteraceae bacterium]
MPIDLRSALTGSNEADELRQRIATLEAERDAIAAWACDQYDSPDQPAFSVMAGITRGREILADLKASREREATLATALDHPRVWEYLNDCHGGRMAPAIRAAHDAEVSRAAKVEALETLGIDWVGSGATRAVRVTLDDGRGADCYEPLADYLTARIAALKAEGGQ